MHHASLSVFFISIAYAVTAQKVNMAGPGGGGGGTQLEGNDPGNRNAKNQNKQNNKQNPLMQNENNDPSTSMRLDRSVIQKSALSNGIGDEPNPFNFAPSLTSPNNFINFCVGATITDGKQNEEATCNPTPMGSIPSAKKMPSVKIKSPTPSQNIEAKAPFEIQVQVRNLDTSFFSQPKRTYYLAPQQLNSDGLIVGHVHVSIQKLSEQDDAPDPLQLALFRGLSDPPKDGILRTTITDGLPAGRYRIATITSSKNHQIVALPLADRGSVEDAIYFSVGSAQSRSGGLNTRSVNATANGN